MHPADQHRRDAATLRARAAVVTLSDTRTPATDASGRAARDALESAGHIVAEYHLIPDDAPTLRALLHTLLARPEIDAIILTGGTGVAPRDITPDVANEFIDRPLPGFGEIFRTLSFQQIGPAAFLSRATAGIAKNKPLFSLPGSTPAVQLAMTQLIIPELPHLLTLLPRA